MTVTSRKYFSDWFVANGINKDWGFDFTILSQDDVIVQVRDGTDDTTIVNHTTDLGFYPAEDFGSGTVRYPIVAAALPVGKQIRILRKVAYLQPERIGKEGKFLPQTHEKALDRVTILTQQVDNNLDLAVKVQIGATPLTVVADLAENRALIRQGDFLIAGPSVTEVSSAQTYATQAGDSATLAQGFATTATNKANEATSSATLAQKFATEAVDTPVLPGLFSAFHWAQKAYDVVAAGIIDLSVTTAKLADGAVTRAKLASNFVSGWASKSTLVDADTFLIGDSAVSGNAKTSSLANLISSIFNGTRAIANGVFLATSFAWQNAGGFKLTHNISALTANREALWPDSPVDLGLVSKIVAPGSPPSYTCRAWVNFDGSTTPPTIRASGNVSSVTRPADGRFIVNLITAMPDANYAVAGVGDSTNNADDFRMYSQAAGSFYFTIQAGSSYANPVVCSVAIFR